MKLSLLVLVAAVTLTGCTSNTPFGPCIGMREQKNDKKIYEPSKLNLFLAVIFAETIIVPISVAAESTYCPVGAK